HGFADARDYYRRASSRYYLPDIRTPSLIIHSSDDPSCSPAACPIAANWHPAPSWSCTPAAVVGFVDGSPRQPTYYLERRIPDWLEARLRSTELAGVRRRAAE
ncbi:hypothetical protein ACFQH7_25310, partial [Microbulbifer taiwanensis]